MKSTRSHHEEVALLPMLLTLAPAAVAGALTLTNKIARITRTKGR